MPETEITEGRLRSERRGGVLLHPTSLPGPHGCGSLGLQAGRWLNWLSSAGMRLWQFLPLGPTGYGDSPYQSFSAFAGNSNLIDLDLLLEAGLLDPQDLAGEPEWPASIDYGELISWKSQVLGFAAGRFQERAGDSDLDAYARFTANQSYWLDDYALFMSLKEAHEGAAWTLWPEKLAGRELRALADARRHYADEIEAARVLQYLFHVQWGRIRNQARAHGISLVGDMPIFVAHDSAEVWSHPELFRLDPRGMPEVVAGVPPDYFSATGQRWGNPLYRWEEMKRREYAWWVSRVRRLLEWVDVIRLDHFRGFAAFWEIPAEEPTAVGGRWVEGPGEELLQRIQDSLGALPLLAEDLGVITADVEVLRDRFGLPGMRVLQFGFEGGPASPYLPHNYIQNCAAYTGTHDNDTTLGWYRSAPEPVQDYARRYLASDAEHVALDAARAIWASSADLAIVPMQDLLELDSSARMNSPGSGSSNWTWRMEPGAMSDELAARMAEWNGLFGRAPQGILEE